MCDFSILPLVVSGAVGLFFGYAGFALQQRFSTINMFSDLVKEEITLISKQPDNIGGEFGVEKWHIDSTKRIEAFSYILTHSRYWNKAAVIRYIDKYKNAEISLRCTRADLSKMPCDIYREIRKMA